MSLTHKGGIMHKYLKYIFKIGLAVLGLAIGLSLAPISGHETKVFDSDREPLVVPYDQVDGPIYWVSSTQVLHNDSCDLYVVGEGRYTRVPTGFNCNFCGGDGTGVTDLDHHPKEQPVVFELVDGRDEATQSMHNKNY